MLKKVNKKFNRDKKHQRIRNKIFGTPDRPRLNVFRSSKHIYAQIIDDIKGHTLASASTLDKEITDKVEVTGNKDAAREVGKLVAKRALESNIEAVVFDRGGYIFHGRIKELADGAREGGLKF